MLWQARLLNAKKPLTDLFDEDDDQIFAPFLAALALLSPEQTVSGLYLPFLSQGGPDGVWRCCLIRLQT